MNLLRHPRLAAAIMSTTVTASSPPAAAAATTASATLASAASAPASDSDSATAAAAAAAEVPELQLDQPPPRSTAWWRWTVATREHQLYYQRRLLRPIPGRTVSCGFFRLSCLPGDYSRAPSIHPVPLSVWRRPLHVSPCHLYLRAAQELNQLCFSCAFGLFEKGLRSNSSTSPQLVQPSLVGRYPPTALTTVRRL